MKYEILSVIQFRKSKSRDLSPDFQDRAPLPEMNRNVFKTFLDVCLHHSLCLEIPPAWVGPSALIGAAINSPLNMVLTKHPKTVLVVEISQNLSESKNVWDTLIATAHSNELHIFVEHFIELCYSHKFWVPRGRF